ncbi:MAG: phosphoribosyltransferase [Haloferacaceae archaeon]
MFDDRTDAGERLADRLVERGVQADVVLAIPRGGLPAGRAVADALGAPLDVVVAKKIGAPHNPELALGAVASDGTVWRSDETVDRVGVDEDYLEREIDREREAAAEKERRYREGRPPLDLAGARVAVVDDGAATGSTAMACLRRTRAAGAAHVVLGLPVAPPDTVEALRAEADEVVVVDTPESFGAVGRFYRDFDQVSDEEAQTYLADDPRAASRADDRRDNG